MRFARPLPLALALALTGALTACQSANPDRVLGDAAPAADATPPLPDASPDCTEGVACDDDDLCTTGDVCTDGRCKGVPSNCADDDPCTADACVLGTGECTHEPVTGVPEGPPGDPSCSDGDDQDCDGDTDAADLDCRACRIDADCPNVDPCRTVACTAGRCAEMPVEDGRTCETGDPCREKGTCAGGRCEAAPRVCPDPDPEDPCQGAVCQPGSGVCVPGPAEDGTPCDDGDACTAGDACAAGVCGGAPRDCSALDAACVAGTCEPESGNCRAVAAADGTPCGGDHCVADGACVSGRCQGRPLDCAELDGQCRVGACDAETGACTAEPVADGTPCDDGDPCTFQDACAGAGCVGMRLDCTVLDTPCQVGRCDPDFGACVADALPDGAPCDDGASCTGPDRCSGGTCAGPEVICEGVDARCAVVTCDEAAGGCVAAAIADGRACDDGDLCSAADACTDGTCAGTPRTCEPPSACLVGACEPTNGACIFQRALRDEPEGVPGSPACGDGTDDDCDGLSDADDPDCRACAQDADCVAADPCARFACVDGRCRADRDALEGAACDDGNPCTTNDLCRDGLCVAAPVVCEQFDTPCTVGRCDPAAGGCIVEHRPDGAVCHDGDPCTIGDVCTDGLCAGSARDCGGLDGECVVGACDPVDGACRAVPRPDGVPCTDGAPCSGPDVCSAGTCAGPPVACEAGPCEVGVCDPASGACHVVPAADGTACDDADPCTEADICGAGACAGRPRDCGALDGACVVGICAPDTGECRAVPRPDDTPCDDGSLCTADETCRGGSCAGTPLDCTELDGVCRVGICDPATGACAALPVGDGTACDDGDACTTTDVCTEGRCVGEVVDCTRLGSLCARGRCDADSGACVAEPINEAAPCDDGNPCTADDVCGAGACAGAGLDCTALDGPCTVGQCNDQGGCVAVPRLDGTACETGDLCDETGVCSAGVCQTAARDCSALDTDCARGTCDPRNGACVAVPAPDATPCDDGSVCTELDACLAGQCQGHPKNCLFLDTPCTEGACDPDVPGGCYARPVVDGIPCSSGNRCQVGEACTAGVCRGTPAECPDPPPGSCRVAVCDPLTGACGFADSPDGTPCNDGAFCTVGETCQAGVCGAARPRECNPAGEPCRTGTCDEANDRCVVQNRPDNSGCEDGSFCTVDDRCFDGVCRARRPRTCPNANAGCRVGRCNEAADRCDLENAFDLKPCSDGSLCTIGDHCEGGACIQGVRVCD
jgi:hypothetical protein